MSEILNRAKPLLKIFSQEKIAAYIVGGAVRDHLMGLNPKDIDIAVNVSPEKVIEIAQKHKLRYIPTGLSHGTITIAFADEVIEVTSFRKDIKNFGRKADVEFSGSLEDDALRRDFRMNAIYMDINGDIFDPLNGIFDIRTQTLNFAGDFRKRIKEDYLRLLRYFRFLTNYPLKPSITRELQPLYAGIKSLSNERIGAEMKKLLGGTYLLENLSLLEELKFLEEVGLHGDMKALRDYLKRETLVDWRIRWLKLNTQIPMQAWRLSNKENRVLTALRKASHEENIDHLAFEFDTNIAILTLHAQGRATEENIERVHWVKQQIFPISGADIIEQYEGKEIKNELMRLTSLWIASGFTLDKKTLMNHSLK